MTPVGAGGRVWRRTEDEGIADEVVDRLLAGRDPSTVFESGGLIDELKKRLAERMLNAELDHHLDSAGGGRSRQSPQRLRQQDRYHRHGKLELAIPRDRHGRFDPVLIGKYRRRFAGFDDKIIALYARGMTTREIAEHIGELYGAEISPDLVSAVTDSVLEEVAAWQSRGLDATYAIVFFDALRVKIRNEGMVNNRAVYLAIGSSLLGAQGDPGHLDRADRRGEVLAAGDERAAQPRGPGHPDRGGRRAQGLSGSDHLGVSQDRGPNLHRASDPVLDAVRLVEGTSGGGGGAQIGLPGGIGRGGTRAAGGFRSRPMGTKVSGDRAELAAQLGAGDSVLRLCPGSQKNPLHHQRDREPQRPGA